MIQKAKHFIKWSLIGCVGSLFLKHKVGFLSSPSGPSMLPTVSIFGDWYIMERITYSYLRPPDLGDLIVVTSPTDPKKWILKRVLGLSGDTVFKDPQSRLESVLVPPGTLWICGDNLSNSHDSRDFGPVSMGLIQGRLWMRLYPSFAILKPAVPIDFSSLNK
jgi:mitochondrial inner membrane protease subunit 1